MSRSPAAFVSHRGHLRHVPTKNRKQIKIHCNRISNQTTRRLEFALGSKPHSPADELTAQICSCTRRKRACMPRQGGCLARVPEEEEERSPGAWSPSSAAAWLPSSVGVMRRRCSMEEEQRRGEGDHGFINLRRRIEPIARMTARPTASKHLTAH
jgi:hypothetical protein